MKASVRPSTPSFMTITPAAPAAAAASTFTRNGQVPRRTSATAPAGKPAKSDGSQPLVEAAGGAPSTRPRSTGRNGPRRRPCPSWRACARHRPAPPPRRRSGPAASAPRKTARRIPQGGPRSRPLAGARRRSRPRRHSPECQPLGCRRSRSRWTAGLEVPERALLAQADPALGPGRRAARRRGERQGEQAGREQGASPKRGARERRGWRRRRDLSFETDEGSGPDGKRLVNNPRSLRFRPPADAGSGEYT